MNKFASKDKLFESNNRVWITVQSVKRTDYSLYHITSTILLFDFDTNLFTQYDC